METVQPSKVRSGDRGDFPPLNFPREEENDVKEVRKPFETVAGGGKVRATGNATTNSGFQYGAV